MAAIIPAIIGLLGSVLGIGESASTSNAAKQAAATNTQIAQTELANKSQIFQQLAPFFSQYLQQGSPFLQNMQAQGAGQNAQQYGNAAGELRQTMGTSGLGYGPSGTTAAALGQLGQGEAQNSASTYLQNLLNNEQVKFQAAQGLGGLGQMMSSQNTVGATPQPVQTTTGSSVFAGGQALQNLLKQMGVGSTPSLPTNPATPAAGGIANFPGGFGTSPAPTQGISIQ